MFSHTHSSRPRGDFGGFFLSPWPCVDINRLLPLHVDVHIVIISDVRAWWKNGDADGVRIHRRFIILWHRCSSRGKWCLPLWTADRAWRSGKRIRLEESGWNLAGWLRKCASRLYRLISTIWIWFTESYGKKKRMLKWCCTAITKESMALSISIWYLYYICGI